MSNTAVRLAVAALLFAAVPAYGQSMPSMDHSKMPGMDHSSMPGMDNKKPAPATKPASTPAAPVASPTSTSAASGTALPAGFAPPPPLPTDHYADRDYNKADMERARSTMMNEQGGQNFYLIMLNLAEMQAYRGQTGFRWDGEAWFGGDINRLTLKSEGGGSFREGFENAEVQALYSRAFDPYFNLQVGVRQDLASRLQQTYGTFGLKGSLPTGSRSLGRLSSRHAVMCWDGSRATTIRTSPSDLFYNRASNSTSPPKTFSRTESALALPMPNSDFGFATRSRARSLPI